jgi:hypothetical protein
VSKVSATEARAADATLSFVGHQIEIASPPFFRSLDDAVGDGGDPRVEPSHRISHSCQCMPSRLISTMAVNGPQLFAA